MTSIPGPRTSPTVKSLAQNNQRMLRAWQLTLGPVQVALLLGVVLGCMACAFYLGFFSGQKVGIEVALDNNISNAMRLPISVDDEEEPLAADEGLSDVYAKLKQLESSDSPLIAGGAQPGARKDSATLSELLDAGEGVSQDTIKAKPDQDLGSITIVDSQSPNYESPADQDTLKPQIPPVDQSAGALPQNSVRVKVLGEDGVIRHPLGQDTTLGGLAERTAPSQAGEERKVVAAVQPQVKEAPRAPDRKESAQVERIEPKKVVTAQEPPKKLAPSLPQTLPRGWFAQVGAPDKRADAESLVKRLRAAGFSVVIENAKVRGQEYFRVLVGPEETKQQAERLLLQLKREPSIKADPFLRMVR